MSKLGKLSRPYRIGSGTKFRLRDISPGDTGAFEKGDKDAAEHLLARGVERLAELQERLYAQDRWAVLLVFQAMDAAGKDGTIKHVMSGVDPTGCQVFSFKAPTAEELDHDFLWRCVECLPERGRIGIFNRSYYEEVLVVRVHPEFLSAQKLPPQLVTKRIWEERYEDINAFESHLARNGVLVLKFFLHVSKEEQRQRLLERLEKPEKNWKFSVQDLKERDRWADYMTAYEEVIRATSTAHAPWHVVPADNKWFTRAIVSSAIIDALEDLDLEFPKVDAAKKRELAAVRKGLEAQGDSP